MRRVLKGKYEILEKIEETDKVAVCSARFINSNNPLVIKLFKRGVSAVPAKLRNLTEDMETHFKLSHNCLAKLYDMDFAGDIYFVAMEYVKGFTLFEMVESGMFVTVPQAVNIVTQLGSLINYIHTEKVRNRQIKLSNILVTRLGQVKVISLSRPLSDMVEGVKRLRKTPTVSSDIFFLGYVLYILITGKYPLDSQNQRIRNFSVIDPETSEIRWRLDELRGNEGARKALERVLIKTTTRNISKRFKTIDNCLEALEKHLLLHEYALNPEGVEDGANSGDAPADAAEMEAVREILFDGNGDPGPGRTGAEAGGQASCPENVGQASPHDSDGLPYDRDGLPRNDTGLPSQKDGSTIAVRSGGSNQYGRFEAGGPGGEDFSGSFGKRESSEGGYAEANAGHHKETVAGFGEAGDGAQGQRGAADRGSGAKKFTPPGAWIPPVHGRGESHSLIWQSDVDMKGESPLSGVDPVWLIIFCVGVIVTVALSWGP